MMRKWSEESWKSFHVSFLILEAEIPANWSDKDSLRVTIFVTSEKDESVPVWLLVEKGLSCECFWWKLWVMTLKSHTLRKPYLMLFLFTFRKCFVLRNEMIIFLRVMMRRRRRSNQGVPSQQLPSFMFLSWSWVLWKIILHIFKRDMMQLVVFSVACIFSWTSFTVRRWFCLWIKFNGFSISYLLVYISRLRYQCILTLDLFGIS